MHGYGAVSDALAAAAAIGRMARAAGLATVDATQCFWARRWEDLRCPVHGGPVPMCPAPRVPRGAVATLLAERRGP